MSLRNDKKVIYKLLEEYKQLYYDIPSLDSVEYITGEIDAYAQFNAGELYNQNTYCIFTQIYSLWEIKI